MGSALWARCVIDALTFMRYFRVFAVHKQTPPQSSQLFRANRRSRLIFSVGELPCPWQGVGFT
jgi:hypothetical protein